MKKIITLFLIYLFAGCEAPEPEGVQVFDFSADIDTYKSFDESNYKLSYEFVPLEGTDRSLIYWVERAAMTDRYIYTISENVNVKIFSRQGKFLKTITHGRANHELIMPNDMMVDEETGNVIFLDGLSMIKTFDSLGNFISMRRLDIVSTEMKKIGDRYLFCDGNLSKVDSNFMVLRGDEKRYYSKKRGPSVQFVGAPSTHITNYRGDLYFMANFDNVLYKMGVNDEEPIEYAIFKNVFADENARDKDFLALRKECEGRKFIPLSSVWRLNEDLIYLAFGPKLVLYDKSTNTPYKHPFYGLLQVGKVQGGFDGKTLHSITREFLDKLKGNPSSQAKVLYDRIDQREKKYGVHDNPYLVIVSYDKK